MRRVRNAAIVGFVAMLASGFVSGANALVVNGTYDFTFQTGMLKGKSYTAIYSYDNAELVGSGIELFTPSGRDGGRRLLSLGVLIEGVQFLMGDDVDFSADPDYPAVGFVDGVVTSVDFLTAFPDLPFLDMTMEEVTFIDALGNLSTTVPSTNIVPTVPLPATGLLMATPLAAFMLRRRRKTA